MDENELKTIIKELRQLKYLEDDDNIRYKNIIKEKLIDNKKLLYLLNPEKINDPDAYYNKEIRPRYFVEETITDVKNILCYTINSTKLSSKYSMINKINSINFFILCDNASIYIKELGMNRHDVIGSIIKNEFNWTNIFGLQAVCTHDEELMVDQSYIARRLYFDVENHNGILKTNFNYINDQGDQIPYNSPITSVINNDIER